MKETEADEKLIRNSRFRKCFKCNQNAVAAAARVGGMQQLCVYLCVCVCMYLCMFECVCAVAGCAKSVHAAQRQAASQFGNCCGCAVGNPDCLLPLASFCCLLAVPPAWLPPPAACCLAALFAVSANKLAKCQLRLLFSRKREIQNRRKTKPKRVASLRVAEQPNKHKKKRGKKEQCF